MDALCSNLGAKHGLALDVDRYRFVQATTILRDRYLLKADNAAELRALRAICARASRRSTQPSRPGCASAH